MIRQEKKTVEARDSRAKRERRFLPREHGAYAQLLFPLLSGLLLGKPTASAMGFAVAAVLLFFAHEPLAIMLGHRGVRLRNEQGVAARRRCLGLVLAGCLIGVAAWLGVTPEARMLALIPVGLAALLIPFVWGGKIKTVAAEMLVIAALASLHLPIGYSSGLRSTALWGPTVVWCISFAVATGAVHTIKARHQRRDPWVIKAASAGSVLAVLAGLALVAWGWGTVFGALGLAILVPATLVLGVNLRRVRPGSLMRVGWSLAVANAVALAVMALAVP
jgi:hypothetical protein